MFPRNGNMDAWSFSLYQLLLQSRGNACKENLLPCGIDPRKWSKLSAGTPGLSVGTIKAQFPNLEYAARAWNVN